MLITKTYHEVPCRGVTVSLWRSQNTIFKCYSAEVAGNSASAKMQNSQMVQSLEIILTGAGKKKNLSNFLQWDMNRSVGLLLSLSV